MTRNDNRATPVRTAEARPSVTMECFDSEGTVAVMIDGIDVAHILVDAAARTAQVVVWDRVSPDGPIASNVTVRLLQQDAGPILTLACPDCHEPDVLQDAYVDANTPQDVVTTFDEYICGNSQCDAYQIRPIRLPREAQP